MDLDEFIQNRLGTSPLYGTFFHFTDLRNLPSIREHGLVSSRLARKRGIKVEAPGGNQQSIEVDQRRGLDAYVHLCFTDSHPMEYLARKSGTIGESIYLAVHPDVIRLNGALISVGVSNKTGVEPVPAAAGLDQLDLEVLYQKTDWRDSAVKERLKLARKCELLIPDEVPLNYVLNLPNG